MAYCVPLGIPHSEFLKWDEGDREKAIVYRRAQNEVCNGCGTRMEEWKKDRFAYVSTHYRCPGCELLEMEKENLPTDAKGNPPKGVHIHLERNVPGADDDDEDGW